MSWEHTLQKRLFEAYALNPPSCEAFIKCLKCHLCGLWLDLLRLTPKAELRCSPVSYIFRHLMALTFWTIFYNLECFTVFILILFSPSKSGREIGGCNCKWKMMTKNEKLIIIWTEVAMGIKYIDDSLKDPISSEDNFVT